VYNILYMSNISKYDVLELLSKKMPFYAATQWLKASNENLDGETPSECMKQDKSEKVYKVLQKELEGK
jgi:hypothetical protein